METQTTLQSPEIKKDDNLTCRNDSPLPSNNVAPPLKVGESYVAQDVITCSCGSKHVNVGLVSEYNYISCFECKAQLPDGDKIHWCHPSRFDVK